MVSQQLLQELKEIIRVEYRRDLSMKEVSEIGNGLVGYYDLLAKIYHKKNLVNEDENEVSSTAKIQQQ